MSDKNNLKTIALKYVERDGERLKQELKYLDKYDTNYLDIKLKKKFKKNFYLLYLVASILILFFSINLFSDSNKKNPDIILLEAKLPTYKIQDIKQDKTKTIYFIKNETNNKIVLTVEQIEQTKQIFMLDSLQEINIKNNKVYALVKPEFNFFMFEKDNMTYTITSAYDYKDLIFICENIL